MEAAVPVEPVFSDQSHEAPDIDLPELTVALEGDGACIAEARHLAAGFLGRLHDEQGLPLPPQVLDATQLVVSELVTNARKYAPGPVMLDLHLIGDQVEVVVWDSDPALPIARPADPNRVGQHGLEIVLAVTQDFEAQREPVGKRVTARIALSDDRGDVSERCFT